METWFDSHCHLYDIDDPAADVVERARKSGVEGMVVLGVDIESSRRAVDLTSLTGVHAGAAFHPTSTKGWDPAWAEAIDELLADPRIVAVGETGIDLYWDASYFDDQKAAFEAHIDLSRKHGKPLVIHTRKSMDEALQILGATGAPERLIFHCWSGDEAQMDRALALGAHISFAGNVSFRNAEDLREAARRVPAERLLVETDSPYLTPVPHRGKRNEPAFVVHTGRAVAEARGEPIEQIAAITTANAHTLFGLP